MTIQQCARKLAPSTHRTHMRQELPKSVHIAGSRLEKVEMGNGAHEMAQYLEAVVDEVGNPEPPAYCCLVVALTAEEHVVARDPCGSEELMPLEPRHQRRLSCLVAPRHQPDAVSEAFLDEPCDTLESALNLRRRGVAIGTRGLAVVVFAHTVDDDAPDVDAERFRSVHAYPSNARGQRPERATRVPVRWTAELDV